MVVSTTTDSKTIAFLRLFQRFLSLEKIFDIMQSSLLWNLSRDFWASKRFLSLNFKFNAWWALTKRSRLKNLWNSLKKAVVLESVVCWRLNYRRIEYRSLKSNWLLKIIDLVKFWFLINNYLWFGAPNTLFWPNFGLFWPILTNISTYLSAK